MMNLNEQEQLPAKAPEETVTRAGTDDAAIDPTTTGTGLKPGTTEDIHSVTDGSVEMHPVMAVSFDDAPASIELPEDPKAEPEAEAEDASYAMPVPSGAIAALLDEIHRAVEYARDEVRDTVRSLVRRAHDML